MFMKHTGIIDGLGRTIIVEEAQSIFDAVYAPRGWVTATQTEADAFFGAPEPDDTLVTTAQLTAALAGFTPSGGSSVAKPTGAVWIFATDDTTLADAHPEFAWVILTPPDTTAPTVPTGLGATAGDTQVALAWTASTDAVGVTGYKVRRGGTVIATVTSGTAYTDTGLTNGTTYSYTVSAVDVAGNESAQTSAVTATPSPAVTVIASDDFNRADTTSPTVGTTSVGSKTWTASGSVNTAKVSGNKLALVSTSGSVSVYATIDAGVADVDVSGKFTPGAAADKIYAVARFQDTNNHLRLNVLGLGPTGSGYALENWVAGTKTDVIAFTGRVFAAGDTWRLKIKGSTYTIYHNGTQLGTGSVTTASTTATLCGVGASATSFATYVDDFSVSTT